jgi:hypothetical protein
VVLIRPDLPLSINVQSPQDIRSRTNSHLVIRQGPFGIILTYVRANVDHVATVTSATQYCDGLRVIYDPADPYRHLYDVGDGEYLVLIH